MAREPSRKASATSAGCQAHFRRGRRLLGNAPARSIHSHGSASTPEARSSVDGQRSNEQDEQRPRQRSAIPDNPSAGPFDTSVDIADEEELSATPVAHASPEVIMAIDLRNDGLLGCAFFSTIDGVLSLLSQLPMSDIDLCESLIIHVQPTTLLVSARAPEALMIFLEQGWCGEDTEGGLFGFVLRALPSAEFSYEVACDKLAGLDLNNSTTIQAIICHGRESSHLGATDMVPRHERGSESRTMRLMRCDSLVNLDDHVSVACAGAVLNDLHRRRSTDFLPDGESTESLFRVGLIQMFSLSNLMLVNTDTLLSLQIVQSELHPNSQAWGPTSSASGRKESLSLYGLFHHLACTPQGRTRLRQIFLRPMLDMNVITQRQQAISLLIQPENDQRLMQATTILRKMSNIRTVTAQLRRGVDSPSNGRSFDRGVWISLRRFAAQALKLRECATSFPVQNIETIQKLIGGIQPASLIVVGDMINKTIDFEQSKSRQRPSVRAGVDSQLDELKRRYDGMGSFLTEIVNHVNQRLPDWACQYIRSCIFLPQLGFLMVVEPDPATGNGLYDGEGSDGEKWEKLFTADGAVFYKNQYMKELDEQYGDMYCEIGDREVEVIHGLATAIIDHEDALVHASDLCGEFDAIVALAIGAKKYQWVEPLVTTDNRLEIEGGRHPLQELVVPTFVSNDCELNGAYAPSTDRRKKPRRQALIVTGPNHSGKSIYLKQTAIIVYLAHIGSYVPASRAIIGLTDKIFTRISTRESVARTESAFSIDLKQVTRAMKGSTPRSLILVDEFGKGTNVDDGAGLLTALLNHFLASSQDMPRFLLATHFHEILNDELIRMHDGLSLYHMDVSTNWKTDQTDDQLTYLFKLAPGCCTSSFGGHCAALNGVPSTVVERADAIALLLSRNEDLSSACAKLTEEEQKQLEMAEAVARRFLQEDLDLESQNGRHGRRNDTGMADLLMEILSM